MANQNITSARHFLSVVTAVAIGLAAVLVAHSIVAYRQLLRIETNQQQGRQVTRTLGAAEKLDAALLNAEVDQRGYLLAADPALLSSYNAAVRAANDALAELLALTADPPPVPQHEALRAALSAQLDQLGTALRVAQTEGSEPARKLFMASGAAPHRQALQTALAEIKNAAISRRDIYRSEADDAIRFALKSLLLSTLVGCGIVVFAFFIVQREVSSRRRLSESLQEADRNKDEFLALLGHELRNPLAAIRSALEVLRMGDSRPEEVAELHDVIGRQTRLIHRLVEDLLDTSRVAHGKVELRRSLLNVGQLVQSATADTRRAIEDTEVAIAVELPHQPLWADADPTRLAQVVSNLLHNAVKFSRRGDRVEVQVSASAARDFVRIRVSDQGIGMDRRTLDCVFAPFAQGKSNGERSRGGLGLGLPLAKGLVELHGGTITAHSDGPGRGAEFVVTLPLENPSARTSDRESVAEEPWLMTEKFR